MKFRPSPGARTIHAKSCGLYNEAHDTLGPDHEITQSFGMLMVEAAPLRNVGCRPSKDNPHAD